MGPNEPAMPQIQIMIVDDSVVVRKVLTNVLSSDPDLTIAGWASNGRLALARLQSLRPDIILLDMTLPILDGWTAAGMIKSAAESSSTVFAYPARSNVCSVLR